MAELVVDYYVDDDEEVYRSVRGALNYDEYYYDENDGSLQIGPNAFRDRYKHPSVDRAKLKDFNPHLAKQSESDGIVTLLTKKVRAIGHVFTKTEQGEVVQHSVDVKPDQKHDNEAHALVVVTPEFFGSPTKQKNAFKLLRISLAKIATENGWTVRPSTEQPTQNC